MWWSPEEEEFQQLAMMAGAIPFDNPLGEDDIVALEDDPPAFPWYIPENEVIQHGHAIGQVGGPVVMNGVDMDYEGDLLLLLNDVLAGFGHHEDGPDL
jgi:hypothetical protein